MASRTISTTLKIDGESQYKKAIREVNSEIKALNSDMKVLSAEYQSNANSIGALEAKQKLLSTQYDLSKAKVKSLSQAYEEAKEKYGENSTKANQYRIQLNNATLEQYKLSDALKQTDTYLDEARASADGCATSIDQYGNKVQTVANETENATEKTSRLRDIFSGGMLANIATQALNKIVSTLKEFAKAALEAGDNYSTLADVTGLSTDKLQELQYAGTRLDVSLDTMTDSFKKLINNMSSASAGSGTAYEAFKKIGVSVTGANGELRDSNDVFLDVVDALGKMENATERDAAAQDILGRSATDLNPLIIAGSDALGDLCTEAENTGAVMSEDAVQALDNFGETIEQTKQRLTALVGDAIAPFISGASTASEEIDKLSENVEAAGETQNLITRYRELSATMQQSWRSADDLAAASEELDSVKQQLIDTSGGVVTALGLENGTFDNQVEKLEELTQAEKDYQAYHLLSIINENSGNSALKKQAAVQEKISELQEQIAVWKDVKAKAQENIANGVEAPEYMDSWESSVETSSHMLDKYSKALSVANAEMAQTSADTESATQAIKTLSEYGLSAEEIAEKTSLTVDEVNSIIGAGTVDASGEATSALEEYQTQIENLEAEYEAAKEAARETLDSTIGLWADMGETAVTSVDDVISALVSQQQWLDDYNANLDSLANRKIDGVDTSALVQSLSDGSEESAAILAGLATATDEQVAEIVESMDGVSASKDTLASAMADATTDYEDTMAQLTADAAAAAEELNMYDSAYSSGTNVIQGFIDGVYQKQDEINTAMINIACGAYSAWNTEWDIHSPSKKMQQSGAFAMEGNILGVESMAQKVNKAYEGVAVSALGAFNGASGNNYSTTNNNNASVTINAREVDNGVIDYIVNRVNTQLGGAI